MTEQRAEQRDALPLEQLVTSFMEHAHEEEPHAAAYLADLDADGQRELAGVLGRFDTKRRGKLDAPQRIFAYRILARLHRPSTASLTWTNKILDYLDLNANALIEENELDLISEIFSLFATAESDNDTLSERELEMLYAVLRFIDDNDTRFLEAHERVILRQGLDDPKGFMAYHRANNPLLQAIIDRRD
jgi:hypothetical protein